MTNAEVFFATTGQESRRDGNFRSHWNGVGGGEDEDDRIQEVSSVVLAQFDIDKPVPTHLMDFLHLSLFVLPCLFKLTVLASSTVAYLRGALEDGFGKSAPSL